MRCIKCFENVNASYLKRNLEKHYWCYALMMWQDTKIWSLMQAQWLRISKGICACKKGSMRYLNRNINLSSYL